MSLSLNVIVGWVYYSDVTEVIAGQQDAPQKAVAKVARPLDYAGSGPVAEEDESGISRFSDADFKDIGEFCNQLKRAGYSQASLNRIVERVLSLEYDKRRVEVSYGEGVAFWRRFERDVKDTIDSLTREEQKKLRDILGSDWKVDDSAEISSELDRKYGGTFPRAKLEQIHKIRADYEEMATLERQGKEGKTLWQSERRADIESLLTPEELREFDLRESTIAEELGKTIRRQNVEITEPEFRKLFDLREKFENFSIKQPEYHLQLLEILGPERYSRFLRDQSPRK